MAQGCFCFYNDEIFFEPDLKLSPFTGAFEYGIGFFTTTRAERDQVFHLDLHLHRLKRSLEQYGYSLPDYQYDKVIQVLLRSNELALAKVKIMVFEEGEGSLSVIVRTHPFNRQVEPVNLIVQPYPYRGAVPAGHKTMNYFPNIYDRRIARQAGYYDALYIDSQNRILESTSANLFIWNKSRQTLETPPLTSPILPGICRNYLISDQSGEPCQGIEKELFLKDLASAEAVFVTNSLQGIVPVKQIISKQDSWTFDCNSSRELVELLNNLFFSNPGMDSIND